MHAGVFGLPRPRTVDAAAPFTFDDAVWRPETAIVLSFIDIVLSLVDSRQMLDPSTSSSKLAIPARYYVRIGEVLLQSGVDLNPLLQNLGLDLATLSQPGQKLTLAQIDQLVQAAVHLTQRSDLGLEMGHHIKLSSHDIVGFGILSSPNVEYGLRLVSHFFRLVMPAFQMRFHRDEKHMTITQQAIAPMSPRSMHLHLEAMASATHFELGELIRGELPDYDLNISMPRPSHAARYAELKGARVVFDDQMPPRVRFRFPAHLAAQKLSLADETALRMAEARCRDLVQRVVSRNDVAGWVRMMMSESSQGMPSLGELAHTLNMSIRTLDRHLKRENTGYRQLLNQTRLDRAKELLLQSDLSIATIAHELDYTDAANFTRAFGKATGLSPSQFRAQSPAQ